MLLRCAPGFTLNAETHAKAPGSPTECPDGQRALRQVPRPAILPTSRPPPRSTTPRPPTTSPLWMRTGPGWCKIGFCHSIRKSRPGTSMTHSGLIQGKSPVPAHQTQLVRLGPRRILFGSPCQCALLEKPLLRYLFYFKRNICSQPCPILSLCTTLPTCRPTGPPRTR